MAVRKSRYQPPSERSLKSRGYKTAAARRKKKRTALQSSRTSQATGRKSQSGSRRRQNRKRQLVRHVLFAIAGITTGLAILILVLFLLFFRQRLPSTPQQTSYVQTLITLTPTPAGVDMILYSPGAFSLP